MSKYAGALRNEGELLISGFLTDDKKVLTDCAKDLNLKYITEAMHNNWLAIYFKK
jgi:hypothetical protein